MAAGHEELAGVFKPIKNWEILRKNNNENNY